MGFKWLAWKNYKKKVKNIKAGYIINCVGHGEEFTYKKSRRGNSLSDLAAINVIKNSKYEFKAVDFVPDGSNERQFCSPGFNLPIGLIMRKMSGTFKEYHNSLDDENFISFKKIIESIKIYHDVLLTIENNFVPIGRVQYGTPQLSKSKINLYNNLMNFQTSEEKGEKTRFILETLNLAEGNMDLLQISELKGFKLIDHISTIEDLLKAKFIKKVESSDN